MQGKTSRITLVTIQVNTFDSEIRSWPVMYNFEEIPVNYNIWPYSDSVSVLEMSNCTCMKFHEVILNGFKVIDWTRFCHIN